MTHHWSQRKRPNRLEKRFEFDAYDSTRDFLDRLGQYSEEVQRFPDISFGKKYVNITLIWNEGIAFGLLSFDQENLYNLLTILIILIIFFILVMVLKSSGLKKLALVMILGGALGNVFDRILYKSVPDFIDFHVGEFHWFIFNIADVFITIGVFSMILFEFIGNNQKIEENEKF